jgi:hypothetical protein
MKSLLKWGIPVVLLLGTGLLVRYGINKRKQWEKEHVLIELRPIQVQNGWGYDIVYDGKVFIHQNIIPDVPGNKVFRSKEDALAVGQLVYQRVMKKQIPMVSAAEIRKLNVYIPDATAAK